MAIERIQDVPAGTTDTSPGNKGIWQFFKQGSAPSTGAQIDSEGNVTAAGTGTFGVITTGSITTTLDAILALVGSTTSKTLLTTSVTGDANARHVVNADGSMNWGPGSAATDTNLYRSFTAILQTDSTLQVGGNIKAVNAGNGLFIKEGANAKLGVATLVAGTVVVANTSVTATSRILLSTQSPGGTVGHPYVAARTAGTSFTITSTSGADTSVIAYHIIEPA